MTDIRFCNNCNNLLFIYKDDDNKLFMGCKQCENMQDFNESKCIFTNHSILKKHGYINDNPNLLDDITLPIIKNNKNIKCPNVDCSFKTKEITYMKYDFENIKFIYICRDCGQKWKNN